MVAHYALASCQDLDDESVPRQYRGPCSGRITHLWLALGRTAAGRGLWTIAGGSLSAVADGPLRARPRGASSGSDVPKLKTLNLRNCSLGLYPPLVT